jgi:hypothetical protein
MIHRSSETGLRKPSRRKPQYSVDAYHHGWMLDPAVATVAIR